MPIRPRRLVALLLLACLICAASARSLQHPAEDAGDHFREHVLPILSARCFECHGPSAERIRGKLLINGRESLLAGGLSGPALVPGDPDASLLIQAVRYTDPDYEMPPRTRLPVEEVEALEAWVAAGAPWPADVSAGGPSPAEHAALKFFEDEVRPLLARNCFECHGPDLAEVEGGLRMSGRAALLTGGARGPALVPGDPAASLLMRAVSYADRDLQMPPRRRLTGEETVVLERWIELGAPWPDEGVAHAHEVADLDIEAGRAFWSFRPPVRPRLPELQEERADLHPIDRFVLARLEQAGLAPSPPAPERELVRRAYSDLIGLPPTRAELDDYLADARPDKWERLIERLLAMPQYGERQARRWLDVVRFAQTNGYERDAEKPYSWRYRDWVIDSFNADKPYDRFLKEQLAGDELEDVTPESLVATGFYHLAAWDSEPDDKEVAFHDGHDDVLRTISEGMLGLTVGCARCHDHLFDPIRQRDYFGLMAFIQSVEPYKKPEYNLTSDTYVPLSFTPELAERWELERAEHVRELERRQGDIYSERRKAVVAEIVAQQSSEVRDAYRTPADRRSPAQRKLLGELAHLYPSEADVRAALTNRDNQELFLLGETIERSATSFEGSLPWALVARENRREPVPTHLLARGLPSAPLELVEPAFPPVLCADDASAQPSIAAPAEDALSTGRRRALAEWIASPSHPTTARVMANRVWQAHFGRGIVRTANDMGATGTPPTHPELLDWLACEWIDAGWSLKALHRLVMTSQSYRMSSRAADERALAKDPANDLFWRQERRRLDAEGLRDAVLAVSGLLQPSMGGRGFFPELSREALAGASKPGDGWELSSEHERNRRAVYCFVKRGMIPPFLELFDFVVPTLPSGERPTTTSAGQALTLLNSDFMSRTGRALAERARKLGGAAPEARVRALFELVLAREPAAQELAHALAYLDGQATAFSQQPARLEVRARVPARLQTSFLTELPAEAIFHGPRAGWRYLRGRWGGYYNDTLERDPARGPALLLDEPPFADGKLRARVLLEPGCELAGFALRARAAGDELAGLEVVLDPAAGEARLVALGEEGEDAEVLARAELELPAGQPAELEIELLGARIDVRLDGRALLRHDALPVLAAGRLGLRTFGDTLVLEGLSLELSGRTLEVRPDDLGPPSERAFETLALVMLNLNEFVHVD